MACRKRPQGSARFARHTRGGEIRGRPLSVARQFAKLRVAHLQQPAWACRDLVIIQVAPPQTRSALAASALTGETRTQGVS